MEQTAAHPNERFDSDAAETHLSPEGFDTFCEILDSPVSQATKALLERKAAWE